MLKKANLYFLLAVMVASTAVGVLGVPKTANAQAADSGEIDSILLAQARSTVYQKLLYQCLEKYNTDSINPLRTVEDLKEGDLIASPYNIINTDSDDSGWLAGYIVDPQDGKLSCHGADGKKIVDEYKAATNYNTPSEFQGDLEAFHFLCTIGFRPVDEYGEFLNTNSDMPIGDCVNAARNGEDQEYALFSNKATNPGMGPAQRYIALRYALFSACTIYTPSGDTEQRNRQTVPMVNMDGSTDDIEYIIVPSDNDGVSVYKGRKVKCENIPGEMEADAHAYVDYRNDPANANNPAEITDNTRMFGNGGGENTSTCRVDGIGWIVCPVVNFMASIVDSTYEILDNSLLRTAPVIIGDTNEGLYQSWKAMRDIANVLFVVVFLFIIFSQVTSFGMDNYGIKRLLPKLIVSAILVNLSFLICAIAVDVSNILGSSLKDLLESRSGNIDITPGNWEDSKGWESWAAISTGILIGVGAAGGFASLGLLIPALFAALGSIIAVVLVLVFRQVLIILLIVISPLAFVALLLPNTESYFSRWRSTFMTMLLLYPIIAIIFGASSLASKIIMASSDQTMVQLMGALASVIPLAVTPVVMKFAGGVLNRFAGIVNDTDKGLLDRGRNRLTKAHENSAYMRGKKARDSLKTGRQNKEFAEKYERGRRVAEKIAGGESIKDAIGGESAAETAKNADALRVYNAARGPGALAEAGVRQLSGQAEKLSDYPLMSGLSAVGQNLPGAKGRAEDLHDMSLHFQGEVEKSTAAALKDAISVFSKELAAAQAGGENQDSFLRERAAATTGLDREAVFHTAASLGRDGVMDDFKETYTDKTDQQAWQRAVSSNAGSLINKAPHQVKGEDAAFNSASGEDIVKFSKHTIQKHMEHLSKLEVDARAAGSGSDEEVKYENAKKSFLNAMQNIKDTDLRGRFKTEIGDQIVESIVNAASTSAGSNLAADLSGVVNELRVHKGGLGPAGTPVGTTPPPPIHGPPVPWAMQTPQQRATNPDDV